MAGIQGSMDEGKLERLAGLFRILSDPTRLSILLCLVKGERNVNSLCAELKLPQPTVSHHLGLLRLHQVVDNRRSGKQIYYALSHGVERNGGLLQFVLDEYIVRVGELESVASVDPAGAGVS